MAHPTPQSDPTSVVLRLRDLASPGPEAPWLRELTVDLLPGLTWVIGDEGCGKTTLLRLLAGDLLPGRGSVALGSACSGKDRAAYQAQVFWMDPRTEAHNDISPREFFQTMASRRDAFDLREALRLAEVFGLEEHLDKRLYMLSTGSRRKTWLAAAFASNAGLTLLDQPTAALDGPSTRELMTLLQQQAGNPRRLWVVADYETPCDLRPDVVWPLPPRPGHW
ncbi:MAG: ABC transporter ATP-binding protein [Burkholderiaceae bacterium]